VGLVLQLYEVREEPIELVLELLRAFDMLPSATRKVGTLSRGQTYKAGLIPIIAVAPDLLLLDEPFASGMDPMGILAMKGSVRDLTARGGTVVYTTQIMDVVEKFSSLVCVLHKGRVLGCDSLERLLSEHEGEGLESLFKGLREAP
jgi:ABC-2 type transport system ATP-binding protein